MTVVTLSHVLHFALFGREMRKTFNNILLTPFLLVQPVRTDSRFCSPQIIKAKNLFFTMVFVQMNTGDVSSKEILSALQHTYENRWTWADLFPVNFEKHITHGRVATHNTAKAVVFSYVILWVCSVIAAADLIKCSSIWKSFCFSFFLFFKNIVPQNEYLADLEEAVQRAFWRVSTCVCRGSFSWTGLRRVSWDVQSLLW